MSLKEPVFWFIEQKAKGNLSKVVFLGVILKIEKINWLTGMGNAVKPVKKCPGVAF